MNIHSGVYVALPTPFKPDGSCDVGRLEPMIDMMMQTSVTGFCVGGATSEYAACDLRERERIFCRVVRRVDGRRTVFMGIGAENCGQVLRLGKVAADCGAKAVLLPPPVFFRYSPEDLVDFIAEVAGKLPLPVILYHIPQFTAPLSVQRILDLIEMVPNIIGVKDSSGLARNLVVWERAKKRNDVRFFCGNDRLFQAALLHGSDGAISGIAAFCPELLTAIYRAHQSRQAEKCQALQKLLLEVVRRVDRLPAIWGIKIALEIRGYALGPLGWKAGSRLQGEIEGFKRWFQGWLPICLQNCASI
jgi:dihydrodipicolinate synthase/N-acetylneuraminate lyase